MTLSSSRKHKPLTYVERLLADLDVIHDEYGQILERSAIVNVDPNRHGGGIFVGYARWGWVKSDAALETSRMALLRKVRDWEPRFRLLFPHATPTVAERLDRAIGRFERWLVREPDTTVPATVDKAAEMLAADVADLRALAGLLPADEYAVRLVVDTNTLIDNPDLAAHVPTLGRRYMVHLLPVVLREIDDLKRGGRNQDLRDAAQRADRRLKGLRTNGDIRAGVRVAGDVYAVFEHIEPRHDGLPSWLDLAVPDDRFVASALLLQSDHPGSALHVATSDINLQTKLAAVGLPCVELP
ncbi:PIN domain-containing protein [Micromonospora zingiberis]|uniref:PIN domain-containing protein n=1 Tax=Micromonospora zingiberis TaxID=2053011 RepID=UPI00197E3921|nr:PIN domain-containing protein [Micromonospora zingiberis]